MQGFRQQGVRWIDREIQKKASREGQMWRWGRYGFSVVALQKECQVEVVREKGGQEVRRMERCSWLFCQVVIV